MPMTYSIPAKTAVSELEIKKSRFIGIASYATSREEAMAQLDTIRAQYPDARHHCWAYQLGHPDMPDSAAMSDDGEPSGTAGKPILNVMQHKEVGDVMLIVVRYFGGIKLGAGGLVRAYSGAAQAAMAAMEVKHHIALTSLRVTGDFRHEQYLRHFAQTHNGEITDIEYSSDICVTIHLPDEAIAAFKAAIAPQDIRLLPDDVPQN